MKQDIVDALIARIREDYTRLDMLYFRTLSIDGEGCAGCLGGNAIALRDPAFMDIVHFPFTPRAGLLEQAAEIMGLTINAAEKLLFPSRWPTKRRNLLLKLPAGTREYGEACIRALQTFQENGDKWPPTHNSKRKTNAT